MDLAKTDAVAAIVHIVQVEQDVQFSPYSIGRDPPISLDFIIPMWLVFLELKLTARA